MFKKIKSVIFEARYWFGKLRYEFLKKIIRKYDFIFWNENKNKKKLLKRTVREKDLLDCYSTKDYINNYAYIKEFLKELNKFSSTTSDYYLMDQGSFYGIRKNLHLYCKYRDDSNILQDYLDIEHGMSFQDVIPFSESENEKYTGYITMGKYRKELLKKYQLPVFTVGPYIAYAQAYYSKDKQKKIKDIWGRTLLVFYSHSTEWSVRDYNNDAIFERIEKCKYEFQTIVLCVYWADVNRDYIERFEQMGVKVVCCGFRSDNNFLSRQKSLLELSDAVLTNGLGTHIGYSIYMGKPVTFIETVVTNVQKVEDIIEKDDKVVEVLRKNKEKFLKVFGNKNGSVNDSISQEQYNLCNSFFGFDCVRSRKEIRGILELGEEIYKTCDKKEGAYQRQINFMMKKYSRCNSEFGKLKYQLLKEAIGK